MRHVIKPLLRHRLMPFLVVIQVAIACAIACNTLFLLQQRLAPLMAVDGVGRPGHLLVVWQVVPRGKPWQASRLRETEMALRTIPGVTSVSVAGSLPMVTQARFNGDVVSPTTHVKVHPAMYVGSHLVKTLGLRLVAGRNFSASEEAVHYQGYGVDADGPAIITQALADKLFPDGKAVGKRLRLGDGEDASRRTVVGVVAHLMRNDFGRGKRLDLDYTMLFPGIPNHWPIPAFGIRVGKADPQQVLASARTVIQRMLGADLLHGIDPHYGTYAQVRHEALAKSRASVWLLAGVSLVVLIVTLAGIMGLTSYWVGQRTRQIGIRRALGASRHHILHDLQIENLLVVGFGVALGLAAAYGINLWLMSHYELSRLPWQYLPVGAALLLVLGQLAVLAPALRASHVPPVVATRSA